MNQMRIAGHEIAYFRRREFIENLLKFPPKLKLT